MRFQELAIATRPWNLLVLVAVAPGLTMQAGLSSRENGCYIIVNSHLDPLK